jgi:xanthine dehydrogenase small subunit
MMLKFILNNTDIETDLAPGTTVLDFVRYRQNLKGTKIGCREGDCGACTVLVGELVDDRVRYRSMTSCLMPLANAAGKHIVTVEGINPDDGSLTPVQQAMVDESGTQCGFCTVGFVMSLTGFCLDRVNSPHVSKDPLEMAISTMDGNICRCTGYKSIERAAKAVCKQLAFGGGQSVPNYFSTIAQRLRDLDDRASKAETRAVASVPFVSGGTDLYVQRPDELVERKAIHLFYDDDLRMIRDTGKSIEIGGSVTVTDLLESEVMQSNFPDLYKHLKLVSSTPIRNMATLAGNFVNASPIGDMTVWFLALNAEITFNTGREMLLRKLYLDYKKLAKEPDEYITTIRFKKPLSDFRFNLEKVSKRTYLDIASVNTAASFRVEPMPGKDWLPPALSEPKAPLLREEEWLPSPADEVEGVPTGAFGPNKIEYLITDAHIAAGGVAPIPLYLKETSSFLVGRHVCEETFVKANEIMQAEISPISDVRGSENYKRLLLRQLFLTHFVELFGI